MRTCVAGAWGACNGAAPTTETCDGRDTDCDGADDASDPDVVGVGNTCGSNVGICRTGTNSCIGSALVCGGPGHVAAGIETCNHLDDDCESATDDGVTAAACTHAVTPTTRTCLPASTCTSLVFGAPAANSPPSDPSGNPPAAMYSNWSGDIGRSNLFRARVYVGRFTASGGLGWVSLALTPQRTLETSDNILLPGAPILSGAEHGLLAAALFTHSRASITLYSMTGMLRIIGPTQGSSACAAPSGTAVEDYTIEIEIEDPIITARLTNPAGCSVSTSVTLPHSSGLDFGRDLYGDTGSYRRYYVGAIGDDEDGNLRIQQPRLEVLRRVSGTNRNNCIGCP
jgi:hypothetical protein